jgi:GAF domain-containing protein
VPSAEALDVAAKSAEREHVVSAGLLDHKRDGQMVIAAGSGDPPQGLIGQRVDAHGGLASAARRSLRVLRLDEGPIRARFERHGLARLGVSATDGLIVPLVFGGTGHGVLIAIDRLRDGPAFTRDDQRLLEAFAASAATAVATYSNRLIRPVKETNN